MQAMLIYFTPRMHGASQCVVLIKCCLPLICGEQRYLIIVWHLARAPFPLDLTTKECETATKRESFLQCEMWQGG